MIEIVSQGAHAGAARVVLFDFDGTLSLIRAGWMEVMVPMMVELLLETGSGETAEQLRESCSNSSAALTGKQTIYQMIELAENIRRAAATLRIRSRTRRCTSTGCGRTSSIGSTSCKAAPLARRVSGARLARAA